MKTLKTLTVSATALLLPMYAHAAVTLTNPLGEVDVRIIIATIVKAAISVSGSIAFLMIIYGGFLWMTSHGNDAQVKKGKDVLTWTILGIALIASAYVITNAIFNALLSGDVAGPAL